LYLIIVVMLLVFSCYVFVFVSVELMQLLVSFYLLLVVLLLFFVVLYLLIVVLLQLLGVVFVGCYFATVFFILLFCDVFACFSC